MSDIPLQTREPLDKLTRYGILLLSCGFVYGSFAGYDSPATLQSYLITYFGEENFSTLRYNMLFSAYSLPNVVLPIYAGSLVKKLGLHSTILLLTLTVFVGVFTYGIGVQIRTFELMLLGRFILGVGAESLTVVQSSLITRHFFATDLSFALSLTLSIGRLTSVLNYQFMPRIAEQNGAVVASWMAAVISAFSVLCSYFTVRLDTKAQYTSVSSTIKTSADIELSADSLNGFAFSSAAERHLSKSPVLESALVIQDDFAIMKKRSKMEILAQDDNSSSPQTLNETAGLLLNTITSTPNKNYLMGKLYEILPADILKLPAPFWTLTVVLICYVTATLNFLPLAPMFFQTKYYQDDPVYATSLVSTPDTLSVILMPLIGLISDRASTTPLSPLTSSRNRTHYQISKTRQCLISGICMFTAHLLFATTFIDPLPVLLILGLGYAMYGSAVYSLMADLVTSDSINSSSDTSQNETRVASAYGISGCLSNTVFALVPLIVGYLIREQPVSGISNLSAHTLSPAEKYKPMELFFACVALFGILCCFILERQLQSRL